MPESLLFKHPSYRNLDSFMLATVIYYSTVDFCRKNISSSRQQEQMIQAARSGRQNIAEGSERASTSVETQLKLTDVARASLVELQLDYEDFINLSGNLPWPEDAPECFELWNLRLARMETSDFSPHTFSKMVAENREKLNVWLNPEDPLRVANTLIRLCDHANTLLQKQLDSIGQRFTEEGGFREKLTRVRLEIRDNETPKCPLCDKPMNKRKAKSGPNAGNYFWGCTGFKEGCNGTRPCED